MTPRRARNASQSTLLLRIAIAHEEHLGEFRIARNHHERRLFLVDAGEVEQIVALPERPLLIAAANLQLRRKEDEDSVRPDLLRQPRAARRVLGGVDRPASLREAARPSRAMRSIIILRMSVS